MKLIFCPYIFMQWCQLKDTLPLHGSSAKIWSAGTCHRFGLHRLVDVLVDATTFATIKGKMGMVQMKVTLLDGQDHLN
ncbi:MAG: hypothetical protein WCF65_08040, partial [Parachlamydiaceae bacterium]